MLNATKKIAITSSRFRFLDPMRCPASLLSRCHDIWRGGKVGGSTKKATSVLDTPRSGRSDRYEAYWVQGAQYAGTGPRRATDVYRPAVDYHANAFYVEPGRCFRLVNGAGGKRGQSHHCAEPVVWCGVFVSPLGKAHRVWSCDGHADDLKAPRAV